MSVSFTAIVDHFKFKNYINVVGKEDLLGLPNVNVPIFLQDNNSNIPTRDISDAIFSSSESPMYTQDFISSFGETENLGNYIKITYEDFSKPDDYDPQTQLSENKYRDTDDLNISVVNYEIDSFAYDSNLFGNNVNPPFVQGIITSNRREIFNNPTKSQNAFSISQLIQSNEQEDNRINRQNNKSKAFPHLAVYQMLDESVSLANRQTLELSVFLNTIPTIEFSRCVPIISAQFLLPGKVESNDRQESFHVANSADFLYGEGAGKDLSRMSPFRGTKTRRELQGDRGQIIEQEGIYSTMDIFLSPQTMVNADTKFSGADTDFVGPQREGFKKTTTVIDKMRPFLSIESFDVDVKPTRGLMSYKSGQLNLVLHDRSRMADIAPFIKPDLFGAFGSEILLEYGWSHPDGSSPYGALLNKMRSREKYMIVNSTVNMTQNGEAKISLQIAMLGSNQFLQKRPFRSDSLDSLLRQLNRIANSILTATRDATINVSEARDIVNYIGRIERSSTDLKEIRDKIRNKLSVLRRRRGRSSRGLRDFIRLSNDLVNKINDHISESSEAVDELNNYFKSSYDPFLSQTILRKLKLYNSERDLFERSNIKYISLGKVLTKFIGEELTDTKNFNEVQLIFYNLNSKCGRSSSVNIANIPIEVKELKDFLNENLNTLVNVSLSQLVIMLTNRFISNKASILYGFGNIYRYNSENNSAVRISRLSVRQADAKQSQILFKDYYGLTDPQIRQINGDNTPQDLLKYKFAPVEFVMPRIAINTEVIAMGNNDRERVDFVSPEPMFSFRTQKEEEASILRVHVYDTSNSPFNSAYDLITEGIQRDFKRIRIGALTLRTDLAQLGTQGENQIRVNSRFSQILQKELTTLDADSSVVDGSLTIGINKASPFGSIKNTYKKLLPTVTYGSQNSAIIDASFSTLNEGRLSTVFITRESRNIETREDRQEKTVVKISGDDLPLRILPAKVDATIFGCPIINFAQHMFFDFGTGTSVDNIYTVSGIKHSISQGKFTSALTLMYSDAYGKFEAKDITLSDLDNANRLIEDDIRERNQLAALNISEISISDDINLSNINGNELAKGMLIGF